MEKGASPATADRSRLAQSFRRVWKTYTVIQSLMRQMRHAILSLVLRVMDRRSKVHQQHYDASIKMVQLVEADCRFTVQKVSAAQKVYLNRNQGLYDADELKYITYYLDTMLYKLQLSCLSIEQLWAAHDAPVHASLLEVIDNSISELSLNDNELFYQSYLLEQFLFQSRSYLDIAMLYITWILGSGNPGKMSKDKFLKAVRRTKKSEFQCKADAVWKYFECQVFSQQKNMQYADSPNWGTLLQSLRDKIAHRDRIRLSTNSEERIRNDILLNYPTLQGLTYESFAQTIENGMYELIRDLFPILYDLEWQAGPYREGMFDT